MDATEREAVYVIIDPATGPDKTVVMIFSKSADGTLFVEDFKEVVGVEGVKAYVEAWEARHK